MKSISKIFLIVAGLLAFASCDKIDEDKYTIFAGVAGDWYTTDADIPHVQRAFIEKYTGVRCIFCPKADDIIHDACNKYGDSVVVVAVHSRSTGFGRPLGNDPSLCTESGDEWFDYFGIDGQPAAMINRSRNNNAWDIFDPTSNFDDRINTVVNSKPNIAISIQCGNDKDSFYFFDINLELLENISDELTLTVLLTEDKIYTRQSKFGEGEVENYEQNHVLRTTITNLWGVDVPDGLTKGDKRMVRFYYLLPDNFNAADVHAVAFVSYKGSRQIINCAQSNLQ